MGPARSGKSTLMNFLSGCTVSEVFATYPGMETFIKGVHRPTGVSTLILPANRSSVIHQVVFDQRATLPYTAEVHVIPRLRFQNGFTNWGGSGSYKTNP